MTEAKKKKIKRGPIKYHPPKDDPRDGKRPFIQPLSERSWSERQLNKYVKNENLREHCRMVADAMEAYAKKLGEFPELWYQTGLLHDIDWEMFPDEHPNKAVNEIIYDYPREMLDAILAHAPQRTGKEPESLIEKYLFAIDELSGLMHALSLMRPNGFSDMKYKSVKKKIKDKAFAAGVDREMVKRGFELIKEEPAEHVEFLIEVFKRRKNA